MKRTIITILMLAACLGAQAQFPHFDFILDTISYPDTTGGILYFPKNNMDTLQYVRCGEIEDPFTRNLHQYIITEPTWVVGLAGTIDIDTLFKIVWRPYIGNIVDNYSYQEMHLYLYREHNGVFTTIDSIRMDTMPLPHRSIDYGHNDGGNYSVIPMSESHFSHDSAYLFGVKRPDSPDGIDTIYVGLGNDYVYNNLNGIEYYHCAAWFVEGYWSPPVIYKIHNRGNVFSDPDHNTLATNWGALFPIVRRPQNPTPGDGDFTCPTPKHLRVDSYLEDCALLMWNTSEQQTLWQVALREENSSWELGSIQSFTTAGFANLCGLDIQKSYYARVRAICEYNDSVYYSAWSDSVAVRPQQAGIGSVEQNMMVTMAPNPASTSVTFNAPYGLSGVELYDLQGRKVAERWSNANADDNLGSMSMTMSLAGLPHGTYVAAIHTFGNVVTRKLVVR